MLDRATFSQRRAQGLGIVEYAWALAGIVGLFLAGQLIAVAGWRAPFFTLSAGLLIAWTAFGTLPPARQGEAQPTRKPLGDRQRWPRQMHAFFELGPTRRSAWSAVLATGLNFFAPRDAQRTARDRRSSAVAASSTVHVCGSMTTP